MNKYTFSAPGGEGQYSPVTPLSADAAHTLRGCAVDATGQQFYEMVETLSPKLKWMQRWHITVRFNPEHALPFEVYHGMERKAIGLCEDSALYTTAKILGIKLWYQEQ